MTITEKMNLIAKDPTGKYRYRKIDKGIWIDLNKLTTWDLFLDDEWEIEKVVTVADQLRALVKKEFVHLYGVERWEESAMKAEMDAIFKKGE